jgi:outer membrane protein
MGVAVSRRIRQQREVCECALLRTVACPRWGIPLGLFLSSTFCAGQSAPPVASTPWTPHGISLPQDRTSYAIDLTHEYSLGELVDLAEEHNPETQAAWHRAKAAAAQAGIARSAFLPTLSAFAFAESLQQGIILEDGLHIEDLGLFQDGLQLNFTIFDFGERSSQLDVSRARLLGANFAFNDTHRRIIFGVCRAYYQLIEAQGREQAARAALANAQTVQGSAEERLRTGLGTLPDALEARSATAQADLQLQQEIGSEEVARGQLATLLGLHPSTVLRVQPIELMTIPAELTDTIDRLTEHALAGRPDLMQQVEALRSAEADIRAARSAYFPTLSFSGNNAHLRAWGALDAQTGTYASGRVWDAKLSLNWTLFDGLRREKELVRSRAEERAARAEVKTSEDRVENEVWAAYSNAKTALRRRAAAVELLHASAESYNAALESYQAGVRTLIDVVSAQRVLASAQSEDISSRAGVLIALSELAFRTGEILTTGRPTRNP